MWSKLKFEDYVEIVEVIEDPDDKTDNLNVPVKNSKVMLVALNDVWEKVVGSAIAEMTWVVGCYGYKLTVEVGHPVYASELKIMEVPILEKLKVELGKLEPPLCQLDLRNGLLFRLNPNLCSRLSTQLGE